jgi:hypothetical protein
MTTAKQMAAARARASVYAPGPVGSYLTYGFIGLSLLGFVLVFLSGFYGLDLLRYPVALIVLGVAAVLSGVVLRVLWKCKHHLAVAAEYANPASDVPVSAE